MLSRLSEDTAHLHGEADGDVDTYLFRPQVTLVDYRTYLARVYGFLVPLEAALFTAPGLDEVIDVRSRAKAALVMHDLLALGMSMDEVQSLPQCQHIPMMKGPAAALGWMYVAERPLLSAAVIRGHLSTFLRAEMALAAAYLSCYQGQAGSMWRELGEAMDRVAYSQIAADCMVSAAQDAFRSYARWRKQDHSRSAGIRIAG